MPEVITLSSDDDDDMTSSGNFSNLNSGIVTVHINEVNELNLNDFQPSKIIHRFASEQNTSRRNYFSRVDPLKNSRSANSLNPIHRNRNGNVLGPVTSTSNNSKTFSHLPSKKSSSVNRFKNVALFEAWEVPTRKMNRIIEKRKCSTRFACTYNSRTCSKIVKGTVGFMNHLWAHVINDVPIKKSAEELQFSQEEREFLLLNTCEHCNSTFTSIFKKQKHVVSCHSKKLNKGHVCRICELDFSSEQKLEIHKSQHVEGDAPYNCRRCKYRSNSRDFLFRHYVESHSFEVFLCPICTEMMEVPPRARTEKVIMAPEVIIHMRKHASEKNRCNLCVLTFSDFKSLAMHQNSSHAGVPHNWIIERKEMEIMRNPTPECSRVKHVEKKYLKSLSGRRVLDEVLCKTSLERGGFDNFCSGSILYQCECGEMNSFNGNRVASHFHRCGKNIKETYFETNPRVELDAEEELKIFSVIPPFSGLALERRRKIDEKLKNSEKCEILTEEVSLEPIPHHLLLNLVASNDDLEKYSKPLCDWIAEK